jgi:lysophospholipase L1-like esterase
MFEYLLLRNLSPDLVVIQGGENDELDGKFCEYYPQLLDHYSVPRIVLGDWYDREKSDYVEELCVMRNIPFVNLVDIYSDPKMSGNAGPYGHKGIATHPNDAGMAAIASAVLEVAPKYMEVNGKILVANHAG